MKIFRSIYLIVIDHRKTFAVSAIFFFMIGCGVGPAAVRENEFMGVGLTGVSHMSSSYNIMKFYVDAYDGGNVGRDEGGGGLVCCVMIPKKWRPGLTVEVRWMVGDWSREVRSEIEQGDYQSVGAEGIYVARVPLEYYSSSENVYVHFFSGGRVRVVASMPGSGSPFHPIAQNDPSGASLAVAGRRVGKLFTEAEREELRRKYGRGSGWK